MKDEIDYYSILGVSKDASEEEIRTAFEFFKENNNLNPKIHNMVCRWFASNYPVVTYISKINILDNNKTCELLEISEATDEQLEGIIRYISKSYFSSRKRSNELLKAISDGDFDMINQLLVGENDEELSPEQIVAIYNYVIKETDYKMQRHVILWNLLMRNGCISLSRINCVENEAKKGER